MPETEHSKYRRKLLHAIGCSCAASVLVFTRPVQGQGVTASSLGGNRKDAWKAAQSTINEAIQMTDRITRSLDTLTSVAATAAATHERLTAELRRLSAEIAKLTAEKDRLLEEYRNGLFCSGCQQTKSQILAKGDTFPHPGQTIIRPTQAQIDAKERDLQEPIDRAERSANAGKKTLDEATNKQALAFDQIRQGVALWRTSVTYWRGSVHRGVREREAELQAGVVEFQQALRAEMARQVRQAKPKEEADAEAQIWTKLLDKQKLAIETFRNDSGKASVNASESVREQRALIDGYLHKNPLPKTLLAVVVVDAPVSPGRSAVELGVNYHLGDLGIIEKSLPTMPPPLQKVDAFVGSFKSAGLPEVPEPIAGAGSAVALPASLGAPQAVPVSPSSGNNRLLKALP